MYVCLVSFYVVYMLPYNVVYVFEEEAERIYLQCFSTPF